MHRGGQLPEWASCVTTPRRTPGWDTVRAMAPEGDDLYTRIVDAAHDVFGSHPGARALHAKGTWCEGTFTASDEGGKLSRAAHFAGDPVAALIRFSNASGDPASHDAERDGRGMAVKLRSEAGETDILATMTPAFVSRTPEDFLELMILRQPDPDTGQPDMESFGAYLGKHPESLPAIQGVIGVEPPASFATIVYYSPHAFRLVDADGNGTWVRYRWRPEAGEEHLPDDEAKARGRDYLRDELAERLGGGPASFELLLQIAEEGDPLEDPTAVWPEERELVSAGRLEITARVDDPEADGDLVVFDPTRVIDGVEMPDDPILHARPKAYSVSIERRAGSG
jgi:catalase